MLDKPYLRKTVLAKRLAMDAEYAAQAAAELIHHLLPLLPEGEHVIAGYWPVRGEIDVMQALAHLAEEGHALCLPVVDHRDAPLAFRRWKPGDALEAGSYGIPVPKKEQAIIPDVILTPLMAFDAQGNRLGYGSGYYDRTIAQLRVANPALRVIGAAYAMQQLAMIPAEPQDEKLDAVVTETGSMRFA